jgi:hypothetical protein
MQRVRLIKMRVDDDSVALDEVVDFSLLGSE